MIFWIKHFKKEIRQIHFFGNLLPQKPPTLHYHNFWLKKQIPTH